MSGVRKDDQLYKITLTCKTATPYSCCSHPSTDVQMSIGHFLRLRTVMNLLQNDDQTDMRNQRRQSTEEYTEEKTEYQHVDRW